MGKRYTAAEGRFPAMLISAAALSALAVRGERNMERPNILVIIADDLRDYGPGTPLEAVSTPTLDRFSREGVCFSRGMPITLFAGHPEIVFCPVFARRVPVRC